MNTEKKIYSQVVQVEIPDEEFKEYHSLTDDSQIVKLVEKLKQHNIHPRLYVQFHQTFNNIECIISSADLATGFEQWPPPASPEQRALWFLHRMAETGLLGIEFNLIKNRLYLKHAFSSQIGTHCLFELRHRTDQTMLENFFAVHLDSQDRIIMFYGVYQRFAPNRLPSRISQEIIDKAIKNYQAESPMGRLHHIIQLEQVIDTMGYIPLVQAKVVTEHGSYVWYIDQEAKIRRSVLQHNEARLGIGRAYQDYWPDIKSGEGPETTLVVLRDLHETDGLLAGKYAKVSDEVTLTWPVDDSAFLKEAGHNTSHFDRVMAYYHLDRVQRFFRNLGLEVLDDYDHLNPVHAVLIKNSKYKRTQFDPVQKKIYFEQVAAPVSWKKQDVRNWTDARDAILIYHEFVHSVTDALARLKRQYTATKGNVRYRQMIQAAAMDEGVADYFACSLAAHHGLKTPLFARLKQVKAGRGMQANRKLSWGTKTKKNNKMRQLNQSFDLSIANQEPLPENNQEQDDAIYRWGQEWGRYLWHLREKLGAEVADMIIAHSLFFLTRWSGFSMGVLVITLADRLLFGGVHNQVILAGAGATVHQVKNINALNGLDFETSPMVEFEAGLDFALGDDTEADDGLSLLGDLWTEESKGGISKLRQAQYPSLYKT